MPIRAIRDGKDVYATSMNDPAWLEVPKLIKSVIIFPALNTKIWENQHKRDVVHGKKYQIFVSSTFTDLQSEREKIIKAILELYHIPIGMEMFSAEDEDQWEIIRRTIDICDYYILIIGLRYGTVTSEGLSFTHKEYEYALSKKIPILAFVLDDGVSLTKEKRDDNLDNINKFREAVLANSKMADFWTNSDELVKKVSVSLMKQIIQKPGIGWIRGDQGVSVELSDELTQLSKENRYLRERVLDLESKINSKQPNLSVKFNNQDELLLKIEKVEIDQVVLPKKMEFSSVDSHLRMYIKQEDIDEYNAKLPTQEVIDKYNSGMDIWYKVKYSAQDLFFEVCNLGTNKANEIFVTITFPKEVAIFENSTIKKFEAPESPLPFSPIKRAEDLYSKEQGGASIPIVRNAVLTQLSHDLLSIGNFRINKDYWSKLDKNTVTLKLESLLHTRCRKFEDDYKIVPLKEGEFEIFAKFICEEYEQEISIILPLKIATG